MKSVVLKCKDSFFLGLGGFLGIASLVYLYGHTGWIVGTDLTFVIGAFGSSAVLLYGACHSPFSQPRNLVGGHVISAIIGVACYQWLFHHPSIAAPVAIALAISAMHVTKTTHPPGGATALIAVIGSEKIHTLGYGYVVIPVLIGSLVMLCVALIVNNLSGQRYPTQWF